MTAAVERLRAVAEPLDAAAVVHGGEQDGDQPYADHHQRELSGH